MKNYIEFINESISINDIIIKSDKKSRFNRNDVFYEGKIIGSFGIEKIGDVFDETTHGNVTDPKRIPWWKKEDVKNILKNKDQFKNSIYFSGGFGLREEYRGRGFGKLIIKKLFELHPNVESIFLYAMDQKAKHFWINTMKGVPILGHKDTEPLGKYGVYLIRLDKEKII